MSNLILALDSAGTPTRWIDLEAAAHYYAKDLVAFELGETQFVIRGGISALTGERSTIHANSIIGIRGRDFMVRNFNRIPSVTRKALFKRDRYFCAYCGSVFKESELEMEHVHPESRGGPTTWENLVSACRHCNARKDNQTPEEAHMPLLYLPYRPSRWESFILHNRTILADQMEFLMAHVPKSSRLRT